MPLRLINVLLFMVVFQSFATAQVLSSSKIANNIQEYLSSKVDKKNQDIASYIYSNREFTPIWINSNSKITQITNLLKNIRYNYKDKPFDRNDIIRYLYTLDNENINNNLKVKIYALLDLKITNSVISLIKFVSKGDVDWQLVRKKLKLLKDEHDINAVWEIKDKAMPSKESISHAISNNNLQSYLESLISLEDRYTNLIKLLREYNNKEYEKVSYGSKLKLGMRDGRIYKIKKILKSIGDLDPKAPMGNSFDQQLKDAIISYQERYNLKSDGVIDRTTTYYLNQPMDKLTRAIIVNLDKTKIYPRRFEKEYVEVNLPDFQLRHYKNKKIVFQMPVVIGKISRPTPIFDDKIKYMVLNPTWTIPDNLIKRDLIYMLKKNPNYLEEHNIYVNGNFGAKKLNMEKLFTYENSSKRVPYSFVQHSGDTNALGRIKFMFPNRYDVYIHDTDNKSLLDRRYKIYSSGCMRVKNPFGLMKTLMNGYSQSKIDKIIATNKPTTVSLKKSIPVHMTYFTVYTENGKAYFKNDIYMYDKIIEESTQGSKKDYFTIPKTRLIRVDDNGRRSKYNPEEKNKDGH